MNAKYIGRKKSFWTNYELSLVSFPSQVSEENMFIYFIHWGD